MSWPKRLLNALFRRTRDTAWQTPPERVASTLSDESLQSLQQTLGYVIREPNLFSQALLHRSYHQRSTVALLSNERMEFLGDSVLNLIVGEYLYQAFHDAHEGELTKIRSRLVNKKALSRYADTLHLSEFIIMSQSAARSVGKGMETIMADTFEAVIAAIYLDGGYEAARSFVERQVLAALKKGTVKTRDENYKSMLLEYAQAEGLGIPRYTTVKEEGPDHDRTFTVEVLLNNKRRGTGSGKNKKEAEQAAAARALRDLA
jgi:ribonuclease-3